MNSRQKQKVISILETEIIEFGKELTTRLPTLKELEKDYNDQKYRVDILKAQIDENKQAISELIGAQATIRKQPHKPKVFFRWIDRIQEILKENNRFMTVKECVSIILKERPDLKRKSYVFMATFKETQKAKNPKVLIWKDKIGLTDWFLNDQPLPRFMKEFLYAAS